MSATEEDGSVPRPSRLARIRAALPRTVLGMSIIILLMSMAAAFSGAVLYAYYEARQQDTNNKVETFVGSFASEVDAARKLVKNEGDVAKTEVKDQLGELQKFAASGKTLTDLTKKASPSVFFVSTVDGSGAPSVGSAFVVFADTQQSFLLTSFTTIAAATQKPAPAVTLRKQGQDDLKATVFTWDEARDLALLTVPKPGLPALPWVPTGEQPGLGDRLFALSGLGSGGSSVTQGSVADISADGLQHDTPVGPQSQGGPLLDSEGRVVAVASRRYSPVGFSTDAVWFAPLIRMSCEKVLRCPNGAKPTGG